MSHQARWWHENHANSQYGIPQIARAISYCKNKGRVPTLVVAAAAEMIAQAGEGAEVVS